MAYHKIPRKFDCPEIASDLKTRLLYSDDIDSSVTPAIADIMGISKRTVYATLDGEIKLSLDFLHAAVIATDGDPAVCRYLEPDGFHLRKNDDQCIPDKATLAEECLDDVPSLARYHKVLADPDSKPYEVDLAMNAAIYELQQNRMKWRSDRGLSDGEK
ncbi:hypothetical protein [uncultured Desulfosarcina sp.]|uniref:hypothetical protein n=1 Tax=uncultured Desulfosarcina sp. TaxID=218289 RepID=UPI0029C6E21E|nr:hypothetical protein [uncultured Desulfosarcina sp.]